jgi:hypothetical protein
MRRIISALKFHRFAVLVSLGSLLGVCFQATAARAAESFDMQISPYVQVLGAVSDFQRGDITAEMMHDIIFDASWDNPNLRIRARNKPAFLLENTSTTLSAEITSFSATIPAGTTFSFGDGDMAMDNFTNFVRSNVAYNDPGVSITGSSLSNGGKTVTVNFSGLTVGKRVLFNLDLDTSSGFPYPDFRTVLFGAPSLPGSPQTAPGSFTVDFANPSGSVTDDFVSPDLDASQPLTFAGANIRPYSFMDMVEHLGIGGQIPEPSSAVLCLASLGALAACRRRRAA